MWEFYFTQTVKKLERLADECCIFFGGGAAWRLGASQSLTATHAALVSGGRSTAKKVGALMLHGTIRNDDF